jgi:DNA-binding transcriptional ArsR family regulator
MANVRSALVSLSALGDPTRREIFERVAEKPRAVGDLARGLPVSRPAVSQHLKVLKEARLVREVAEGTKRIYHIDPRGVGAMREWLDKHWAEALAAFQKYADNEHEKEKSR